MSEPQRPHLIKKDSLSISGESLIELIRGVHQKGASLRFLARGISMSPFIKDGDIITVAPAHQSPVSLGDIVAFIHPENGKPVVHRIVEISGSSFVIRGDNLQKADGLIPDSNILGIVTKVERNSRNIYIGLGFEKYLIAALSGRSLLTSPIHALYVIKKTIWRGLEKVFL